MSEATFKITFHIQNGKIPGLNTSAYVPLGTPIPSVGDTVVLHPTPEYGGQFLVQSRTYRYRKHPDLADVEIFVGDAK
jgi:hypothetical protein